MTNYVARTMTEVVDGSSKRQTSKSLQDYEDQEAYVLLGAPGAGKTTEFVREAARQEGAEYVNARDFITLNAQENWKGETLFIDGLDEMRANPSNDPRTPLDRIRTRLNALGCPRFRLSCREGAWLEGTDKGALKRLMGGVEIQLLRLNPLADDDISIIAGERGAPPSFADAARKRGLSYLLENPLTLNLLLDAQANDAWPNTLSEALQQGCAQLSREFNEEHQAGKPSSSSTDDLLYQAGHLCTVILLGGLDGIRIRGGSSERYTPVLEDLSGVRQEISREAMATLLFKVEGGLAKPGHRQIAEYLAAGFLAKRIEEGLSPRRVLAVLIDKDSRIATPLRGLAAWLAALCRKARHRLIQLDPIGVVSCGDVKGFSPAEKQKLLASLEDVSLESPWTLASEGDNPRWGFLATDDMEEPLKKCLIEAKSSESKKWLSYVVLDSLRHAPIFALMPLMLEIIGSNDYPVALKMNALDVCRNLLPSPEVEQALKKLLDDVVRNPKCSGRSRLVDLLLGELYPSYLRASDLPPYLMPNLADTEDTELSYFWRLHVLKESRPEQLCELLDGLMALASSNDTSGSPAITESEEFGDLFCGIFIKVLESGTSVEYGRCYPWLDVATKHREFGQELQTPFDSWLREHPDAYLAIVQNIVLKSQERDWDLYRMLGSVEPPKDYPLWCIEMACQESDDAATEFWLQQAWKWGEREWEGRARYQVRAQAMLAVHPDLLEQYARISAGELEKSQVSAKTYRNRTRLRDGHHNARHERTWQGVKLHESALSENCGPPKLLDQLAGVYCSNASGVHGESGKARLLNYLNQDGELAELALQAFRDTPKRHDLPTEKEILDLAGTDQRYLITRPYLCGLEEAVPLEGPLPDWFDEIEMRRALAFRLSTLPSQGQESAPKWYRHLLANRPQMVAEVLQQVAKRFFRSTHVAFPQLYELSETAHEEVAKLVVMPLLRGFPVRLRNDKLSALSLLMEFAWRHVEKGELLELIEFKLSGKSLMSGQRVYWTCLGLALDCDAFHDRTELLFSTKGGQRLLAHLIEFLFRFKPFEPRVSYRPLSVAAKRLLIEILGPRYLPDWPRSSSAANRSQVHGSVVVNGLINSLAAQPEHEAQESLKKLAQLPSLQHLQDRLRFEAEQHRRDFPESGFDYPDPQAVLNLVENRDPANVPDLMAIATDHIDRLADRIRNSENSDWQQYWDGVSSRYENENWSPLDEPSCRNCFLSDLQLMLPEGIRADGEARHTGETRSDVRVSYGEMEIPIEFKLSHSRDLWTAIENQLVPKYTPSPGAKGHGMLVVFWFGPKHRKVGPEGQKPDTPEALQDQIQGTLSEDQARKISVRVIDVSKR